MISIKQLEAGYDKHKVLDRLTLNLEGGTVHGLIGLNGSGKTTFFRCMAGLIKPDGGSLLIDDIPLKRTDVAFMETEPWFYHGITGKEYLNLFRDKTAKAFDPVGWARLFSLPVNELIDTYSTGMRKKLALLAVLKINRRVVLLDEPFNGLDLESVRIMTPLIKQLSSPDRLIIVSSHLLETLKEICHKVHHLDAGRIRKTYSGDSIGDLEKEIFGSIDENIDKRISGLLP
jgi:ABC-2 type transport system ATP-binding protein